MLVFFSKIQLIIIHIPIRVISFLDVLLLPVNINMKVLIQFQHVFKVSFFVFYGKPVEWDVP